MLIEAAKGGHTNVVHLLLDYPHSVMMQTTADGEARKTTLAIAHEPEEPGPPLNVAPPGPPCPAQPPAVAAPAATVPTTAPQATPVPSVTLSPQAKRSLLRKTRPPSTSESGLTTAEAQQVRSQPIGEPAPEPDAEDKPDSPLPNVDASVQQGATQPFQVSKACHP